MLSWIFKRKAATPAAVPAPREKTTVSAAQPAAAPKPPAPPKPDPAVWDARLKAALGNDEALLSLAREAPIVETKLAAVLALAGEDALKAAEREFRTHDRRVHRATKQRLAAAVAQREARERASVLIASAEALLTQTVIPANRLVGLDRDWQLLELALIDDERRSAFTKVSDQLTALTRQRGEHEAALLRWSADSAPVLARVSELTLAVAEGTAERSALAEAVAAAQATHDAAPVDERLAERVAAFMAALQLVASVDERLLWLAEAELAQKAARARPKVSATPITSDVQAPALEGSPLHDGVTADTAAEVVAEVVEGGPVDASVPAPALEAAPLVQETAALSPPLEAAPLQADDLPPGVKEASPQLDPAVQPAAGPADSAPEELAPAVPWAALPPVGDARVAAALNARFEQFKRAEQAARAPRKADKTASDKAAQDKRERREQQQAIAIRQNAEALEPLLQQAEAALAEGHLAETQKQLTAIDHLGGAEAAPPVLRGRIYALQAEFSRLKGWQQWGGGRVRDDLVQEAEALAALIPPSVEGEGPPAAPLKLAIKPHADAIDDLRKRWKELDRLGGASNQGLWQRFDAALKLAYQPVAAHLAQLEASRQANLQAREALIGVLDAVALPSAESNEAAATGWKELARALDAFQTEWRKLGPVEHTVPRKARDRLLERMRSSVGRVEQPLHEARRGAQRSREQLVARAKALGSEAETAAGRDTVSKVRELQAEWQQQARALPLARGAENALWAEFKAATDAVFTQREAVFNARDAVLKANQATCEALIGQLEALHADSPASEIKRVLGDVDAQWRHAGEVPRSEVAALETHFRNARDAAARHLADSAQRKWHVACDALTAKLTLCESVERDGVPADAAELDARWAAEPALLPAWERALGQRWQQARQAAPQSGRSDALNGLLLQLEMALDVASPAEFQPSRRDLKLQAMKAALEGRSSNALADQDAESLLALTLSHARPDDGQRARLHALLNALRAGRPLTRR